ncbi:MAG TPA: PD-(D/E)XK nuclease family protein [Pirellulales bacterium]|nr:PD-(D/E)XK nuclease family protein [Pirellulales bacterium]
MKIATAAQLPLQTQGPGTIREGTFDMPGRTVVIAGPSGSGKTERLLAGYRTALRAGPIGSVLWIAPTHRSAAEVRQAILRDELRACFKPAVMTFDQFAEQVLAASDRVVRPISDLAKRQILRRLIKAEAVAGRLDHFRSIAETAGLADLVTEFISELKRQEIWPDEFEQACRARGRQRKDQELSAIYRAYQQHLNDNGLYDAEGRFWTARELLLKGQRRPFEQLRHVVVDGFTDFTRPQLEILELLAKRVARLEFSLPLEAEEGRPDLFAKPASTLAQLRWRIPAAVVETLPRKEQPAWPALAHVERELFKNPRHVVRAARAPGIEVSEAGRALDEAYLVARRIKRLLVSGDPATGSKVSPADVVVVARSPAGLAEILREAFDDLGIPHAFESGIPLARIPLVAALVAVLRLHVEDWPFRGLLHVLGSNYFRPAWPAWNDGAVTASVDQVIRSQQVSRGRETLLMALRRAADAPGVTAAGVLDRDRREAQSTLVLLEQLAAALDRLPRRTTPGAWLRYLVPLANELGLTRDLPSNPQEAKQSIDAEAWRVLREAFAAVEKFATGQGAAAEELDAAGILDLLTDIAATEELRPTGDESGCVRVLSATSARALSIPYLFFVSLSERAFPPPERSDRLYNEAEYERFADAGLPLVLRAEASQREMLLFYEVITRARRRLYLSYPGLDEKGQQLLPSPYLGELEDVCGGRMDRYRVEDLRPLPYDGIAASATEQRILAVAQAAGIEISRSDHGANARPPAEPGPVLAGLTARPETRPVFENILAGLAANSSRAGREEFGPYEGLLGAAVRTSLATRFGAEVRFSASRLEQYKRCPFRFFLSDVLHLEPVEELSVAIDPLSRGSELHDALARLHREVNQTLGRAASPADPAAAPVFEQALARLMRELERRAKDRAQPFQAALAEIERRQLRDWLADYTRQHAKYDALWESLDRPLVPAYFEVSFGDDRLTDDSLSTVEPLVISDGARQVLVRGRIDRVDVGHAAGRPVFGVLDYKSGKAKSYNQEAIESGEALQVFLYALAAEKLFAREQRIPWNAGYWFVTDEGYPEKTSVQIHEVEANQLRATKQWQELRDKDTALVLDLVEGMQAGKFPVFNDNDRCTSFCDFRTVCRVNQVRATGKKWQPQTRQD